LRGDLKAGWVRFSRTGTRGVVIDWDARTAVEETFWEDCNGAIMERNGWEGKKGREKFCILSSERTRFGKGMILVMMVG
jgi:hypothetical protein